MPKHAQGRHPARIILYRWLILLTALTVLFLALAEREKIRPPAKPNGPLGLSLAPL